MPFEQVQTVENDREVPDTQIVSKLTSKKTTSKNITHIFDEICNDNEQNNNRLEKQTTLNIDNAGENYSENKKTSVQFNQA